jgi:hypothetical protein
LIRTSMTLNINPQDYQKISFLANGTHLGLLSQSTQNIHVQTSHRSLQLIVAIRAGEAASSSSLTMQRQQINAWQSFFQLLSRRGAADLNGQIMQYHLQAEWLVCLDEHRLQAWLPTEAGFYLLRQENLRRLRPVTIRDMAQPDEDPLQNRLYYSLPVANSDQFFVLPPALLGYYNSGEASGILLGLRQLPARMGDLFNTARARGYNIEETWLALQITHFEPDEVPGVRSRQPSKAGWNLFSFFHPGSSIRQD